MTTRTTEEIFTDAHHAAVEALQLGIVSADIVFRRHNQAPRGGQDAAAMVAFATGVVNAVDALLATEAAPAATDALRKRLGALRAEATAAAVTQRRMDGLVTACRRAGTSGPKAGR